MKNFLVLVGFIGFTALAFGQTVPRYVLVEHFTNTWCPICASRNPALNDLMEKYAQNVHRVSIHPPYPYSGCPLYQFNKTENQDRANYYNIFGSPSVVLNGGNTLGGTPLVSEEILKKEIQKTSPLAVVVTESNKVVTVTLKPNGSINGSLRLMVLLAERNLRFTASNGELDHHDVMRKFLTPVTGQEITIPDAKEQKFTFTYTDQNGWKPEEMYALAFVQNASTHEVINSGTRFDALTTPLKAAIPTQSLKIYPSIASDLVYIDLPTHTPAGWDIINAQGQIMLKGVTSGQKIHSIYIGALPHGLYWLKLNRESTPYTARFIKR